MPTFTSEDLPLANTALEVIDSVLERGHPIVVAWSSGKDSSVVANLALSAAARRVAAGKPCPRLLLTHSDTGVENPEVRALADGEMQPVRVDLFIDDVVTMIANLIRGRDQAVYSRIDTAAVLSVDRIIPLGFLVADVASRALRNSPGV